MAEIPEVAVKAAMEALKSAKALYGDFWAQRVATTALEAAAPLIAAAQREADAQLIEAELDRPGPGGGLPGVNLRLQHVANLLRNPPEGDPDGCT